MADAIPPSLGRYPMTSTPFYLVLYAKESHLFNAWRGEAVSRDSVIADSSYQFILPLPEKNLSVLTALKFSESANRWQAYNKIDSLEEKLKEAGVEIAGILGEGFAEAVEAALVKGFGDASIPMDYTAISVFGTQKRSFRFSLELFSAENQDAETINRFCRLMHGLSTIVPTGDDVLKTPAIFTFQIWSNIFVRPVDVTSYWYPDPQGCAMISFNNTPSDFIQTFDGKSSARQIITMDLTEIEPIAYSRTDNAFVPTWANANP